MDKKDKELEFLRGLEKLRASDVKSPDYTSPLDQDIMKVKGSTPVKDAVTRISGSTDKIDTKGIAKVISGSDFQSKIQSLLKGGGKKALGALPLVGAGMALASGEPAMAAEELAEDIVGLGPGLVARAAAPGSAGISPEDERMMLAEIDAQKAYDKSPARMDRLRNLMQSRNPASVDIEQAKKDITKEVPMPNFASDIPAENFEEERRKAMEQRDMLRRLLEKQRD